MYRKAGELLFVSSWLLFLVPQPESPTQRPLIAEKDGFARIRAEVPTNLNVS